jgi:hypothetical protein
LSLAAQGEVILAKDAKKFVNQRATVEGVVVNVRTRIRPDFAGESLPRTPLLIVMSATSRAPMATSGPRQRRRCG